MKTRCAWVNLNNEKYVRYHDEEWGRAVHDDQKLFEILILEGAQAGLSWETVLNKRENYRQACDHFDIQKIIHYDEKKMEELLANPGIIRNRLKIFSLVWNAKVFQKIQQEYGSFDNYIWGFVDYRVQKNTFASLSEIPVSSEISDTISRDLKKRGMKFVGTKIIYAYMQAIGMVNDHCTDCFLFQKNI